MKHYLKIKQFAFIILTSCLSMVFAQNNKTTSVYLIGDSTVADYTGDYEPGKDYMKSRYPVAGWGQEFQPFFSTDKTKNFVVKDKARGGRSTRTFFQEGRWREVYENLQPNDWVLIQFGHNDAAENKPERAVNIEGYKEFLRLYVAQTLQKKAFPIILSPVARNYPWKDGQLQNVHGEYPKAAAEIAKEMNIPFIDLNTISMNFFSEKGQKLVSEKYFMNLPANVYEAYPNGEKDNTHFQIEGAKVVAELVFNAFKDVINQSKK